MDDPDEPMGIVEGPVTECAGVGWVEAEAIGNLVAVVVEYERRSESSPPLLNLSGSTIPTCRYPTPRLRYSTTCDRRFDPYPVAVSGKAPFQTPRKAMAWVFARHTA